MHNPLQFHIFDSFTNNCIYLIQNIKHFKRPIKNFLNIEMVYNEKQQNIKLG